MGDKHKKLIPMSKTSQSKSDFFVTVVDLGAVAGRGIFIFFVLPLIFFGIGDYIRS